MRSNQLLFLLTVLGPLFFGSCAALKQEPWQNFKRGSTTVGASTGWAAYEAEVDVKGTGGSLDGAKGSDTSTLDPNYGLAVKAHHFVTDELALGAIVEYRSFSPEPIQPLSATFYPDDFETLHFIASSRYFIPIENGTARWKPFAGIDLSYIPEVKLGDVTVDYGHGFTETIPVDGGPYWALGLVGGVTFLLADSWTLDLGAFYEWPLTTSDASLSLNIPGFGPGTADAQVSPRGLIGFIGFSYSI